MKKYHFVYTAVIICLFIFSAIYYIKYNRINVQLNLAIQKNQGFDQYYKLMTFREKEATLNNTNIFNSPV
jgi:hypothetical protein